MAPKAVLALFAGTVSIATVLAPIDARARPGTAAVPPPRPAMSASAATPSVDLPPPELPASLGGLEAPQAAGFASPVPLAVGSEPWSVPHSTLQAIFAQPVALRLGLPPLAPAGIRELMVGDAAARDPSLARHTVLPPPRPSFLVARVASGGSARPIVEVRARELAWPAVTAAPVDAGAIASLSGRPERPIGAGMASWYGPGFHGRKTASGERFDQNALTAAHRFLPFGTKVRVVDEKTGRSIVVRINDRGPFSHGRVIDLSKASAEALGMGGLARVKIVSAE